MDYVTCLQIAGSSNRGFADTDGAMRVALLLYRRAALSADGSGDTAAKLKPGVGGVDYCVSFHLRNVTTDKLNDAVIDFMNHCDTSIHSLQDSPRAAGIEAYNTSITRQAAPSRQP